MLTARKAVIMGGNSKKEYLLAIWERYQNAGKKHKTKILDEFCQICGFARKYAIGLLNRKPRKRSKKPGPKIKYGPEVIEPLKAIWLLTDQMCSKRLKVALPIWLPFFEQERGGLDPGARKKLLAISPAAIDRHLKKVRVLYGGKGLSGTKPGGQLRHLIPIRTDNRDVNKPGFLEVDTVAHCGSSMAESFIWSITFTDVFSQWTENRAIWNKGAKEVLDQVSAVEKVLPFALLSFDVDNGSEFMTHHLWRYFLDRPEPVELTRSRPYRKNDQAHVEQKNWTHVRQLLGYCRLEKPELIPLINELYEKWGDFHNFFCPSLKLLKKERRNSKTIRKYEVPQTPYARLVASCHVGPEHKRSLQARHAALNPLKLKKEIEDHLKKIFKIIKSG